MAKNPGDGEGEPVNERVSPRRAKAFVTECDGKFAGIAPVEKRRNPTEWQKRGRDDWLPALDRARFPLKKLPREKKS